MEANDKPPKLEKENSLDDSVQLIEQNMSQLKLEMTSTPSLQGPRSRIFDVKTPKGNNSLIYNEDGSPPLTQSAKKNSSIFEPQNSSVQILQDRTSMLNLSSTPSCPRNTLIKHNDLENVSNDVGDMNWSRTQEMLNVSRRHSRKSAVSCVRDSQSSGEIMEDCFVSKCKHKDGTKLSKLLLVMA